jgi:hypothetical protein
MASSSRSKALYFCSAGLSFFREEGEWLPGVLDMLCSTTPMADVEASVTSPSVVDGSGCASRVTRDKLVMHSSKALRSSGVQMIGWEPLTLEPDRTSCSGA